MKAWERARFDRRCGLCGQTIAAGSPLLVRSLAGQSWQKVRCLACAGEPAPELPTIWPRAVPMTPILPMERIGLLSFDWKHRAVGRVSRDDE